MPDFDRVLPDVLSDTEQRLAFDDSPEHIELWQKDGGLVATLSENESPVWQALFAEGERTM